MRIERNSRDSRALDILRFPLAVLIVLLHTGYGGADTDAMGYMTHFIINNIVVLAVPVFYFMSGYLFFVGKENFSSDQYIEQLRKKTRGLLLPYVLWNLIAYVFSVLSNYILYRNIGEVMPWNIVSILWANGHGVWSSSPLGYEYPAIVSPACGVLWFIRDLMVMMLCSPVIYLIVKKLKWIIFPLLLGTNIIGLGVPFIGFSLPAITFFTLGAYFSISEKNIFELISGRGKSVCLIFLFVFSCKAALQFGGIQHYGIMHQLLLWSGIPFCFTLAYHAATSESIIAKRTMSLAETSFWIYCLHGQIIIWLINKELGYALVKIPYIGYTLEYVTMFGIRVIECVLLYYIFKKYLPSVLAILTGGRVLR